MCQSISDLRCGKVQLIFMNEVTMNAEKEKDAEGRRNILRMEIMQKKLTQKQDIRCFYFKL